MSLLGETLAARRRRIAEERDAALKERAREARPLGTNPLGHSEETRQAMGLAVLLKAFALAQAETGAARHPRLYCMEAGEGGIASHYAQRLLGFPLERPYSQGEVLALLRAAIVDAGGTVPAPPKAPRRKSGPKVSDGRPSPAEVERRRSLLARALEKVAPLVLLATTEAELCAALVT